MPFVPPLRDVAAARRRLCGSGNGSLCAILLFQFILCAAMALPGRARAETDVATVESLKRQVQQMQQFQQQLQQQMQALERKIGQLESEKAATRTGQAPAASGEAGAAVPPPAAAPAAPTAEVASPAPWLRGQPMTIVSSGSNYLNLSFDTIVNAGTSTDSDVKQLQPGDHDPDQRGFSLRNAELALDGAVDPYFKAFANVVFKLDEGNETELELEEAYGLTTSLPWNLQVKAGQYFAEFGRQNAIHPHAWAFVDQPLIMGRVLGGEGLRNVGARVSWLAPTPFYTELLLSVFNGEGGNAFSFRNTENTYGRTPVDRKIHSFSDLLFVPRVTSSFDLTDTQTIVLGASGAFGPNDSGHSTDTQIYGGDLYWNWRPVRAQRGFPFVSSQTEVMVRRYEAGRDPASSLPSRTLDDSGFYTQMLWGFRLNWVAGLRGEYVTADDRHLDLDQRGNRTRLSPNLTWLPTEFSKLRLQYNYDHGQAFGDEHSMWLQLELILGAHGAHKF